MEEAFAKQIPNTSHIDVSCLLSEISPWIRLNKGLNASYFNTERPSKNISRYFKRRRQIIYYCQILGGGNFQGVQIRGGEGKIFQPMKKLVFAMIVVLLIFLELGVKFSPVRLEFDTPNVPLRVTWSYTGCTQCAVFQGINFQPKLLNRVQKLIKNS